ncbi:MAG: heavy metal-binding domain-containing protein [Pirellulales bacterium]
MDYIEIVVLLVLLALGLLAGGYTERRHFRSLSERESNNGDFLISQLRNFPEAVIGPTPPTFVVGEAVIASDYLKTFLSGLRKIFGGEMRSYQSLLTRARREALQRVVEDARSRGYNAICNVRLDGADVGGNSKARRRSPMAAIIVSATAYHRGVSRK